MMLRIERLEAVLNNYLSALSCWVQIPSRERKRKRPGLHREKRAGKGNAGQEKSDYKQK